MDRDKVNDRWRKRSKYGYYILKIPCIQTMIFKYDSLTGSYQHYPLAVLHRTVLPLRHVVAEPISSNHLTVV